MVWEIEAKWRKRHGSCKISLSFINKERGNLSKKKKDRGKKDNGVVSRSVCVRNQTTRANFS